MEPDIYYVLLGVAAVISALNGTRTSRNLVDAIKEMRLEMANHRARLERLENVRMLRLESDRVPTVPDGH